VATPHTVKHKRRTLATRLSPRKTGAADRIPGASVGEARTEERAAAVRGEDRKESEVREPVRFGEGRKLGRKKEP